MINKAVEMDMMQAHSVIDFAGLTDEHIAFDLMQTAYSNIHSDPKIHNKMCLLNDKFHADQ
jgi:hypothetical protein